VKKVREKTCEPYATANAAREALALAIVSKNREVKDFQQFLDDVDFKDLSQDVNRFRAERGEQVLLSCSWCMVRVISRPVPVQMCSSSCAPAGSPSRR
jgi:hypothetical protein